MPVNDAAFLRRVPLFAQFDEDALEALAAKVQHKHFHDGDLILKQGETGDTMYIVRDGQVDLFVYDAGGERVVVDSAKTGALFGELSAIDGRERSASAAAIGNTLLMVIRRDDLYAILRAYPDAAIHMLGVISGRIRITAGLLQDRVLPSAVPTNDASPPKTNLRERLAGLFG
jgi:CRP-like cAMP-binding protein